MVCRGCLSYHQKTYSARLRRQGEHTEQGKSLEMSVSAQDMYATEAGSDL